MRLSTATARPVQGDPEHPAVRRAIADLIRDYHPTELRSFDVQWTEPDRFLITADVPSKVGQQVLVEVIVDTPEHVDPLP
jgi:hypothetical protein